MHTVAAPIAESPLSRARVLVVDDEAQMLVALEDALSDEYEVLTAHSPEHAFRLMDAESDVAVVISDQRMPGMTGDELLTRLSARFDATRVMLTGYAELASVIRAVNSGRIFAYLTKPWDGAELRLTVRRCVEHFVLKRRLEHERQLLEDLMNNVPDAIYFKDRGLRFAQVNQACASRIGLPSTSSAIGKRLGELGFDAEQTTFLETAEQQVLEQGATIADLTLEHDTPRGPRFYSTTLAPLREHGARVTGLVGVSRDVTARVETERKLRRMTNIHTMLGVVNTAIVHAKERAALLEECCRTAVEDGQLAGATIFLLPSGATTLETAASFGLKSSRAGHLERLVARAVSEGRPHGLDAGSPLVLGLDVSAVAGLFPLRMGGRFLGVFALVARDADFFEGEELAPLSDIAHGVAFALDHLDKSSRLEFLAWHDELTRLPRRALLLDRLRQLLSGPSSSSVRLAVVVVDVSRLRHVNDTLGRASGDELLTRVGERLAAAAGRGDTLARFDSSSFALLLASPPQEAELPAWIERAIVHPLQTPFLIQGVEIRITARLGVALAPSDASDAEGLLRNAEAALSNARTQGQRCLFYAPSMNARAGEKLGLETRLRRAVERREFVLHYQPKIDLGSRAVVGLEALIRWNDPERGLVPPGSFISLLEETGLILDAGTWALETAAAQFVAWTEAGLSPPPIAVNVSVTQLRERGFVQAVERVFERYPGARGGIDLEITESVFMTDLASNIDKLAAVRAFGARVAIDDFGTGYSSLGYLSRLPIDALKIDRSFVERMSDDPQDMTIVTTIISLAHALELEVIAEGVETAEQARLLKLVRCDQIQGYLVARPQAAGSVTALFGGLRASWPPPAK